MILKILFAERYATRIVDEIVENLVKTAPAPNEITLSLLEEWIRQRYLIQETATLRRHVICGEIIDDLAEAKIRPQGFSLIDFVTLLIKHEAPGFNALPELTGLIEKKLASVGVWPVEKNIPA